MYPYVPSLPTEELGVLASALTGKSKLTDPHDIHAAHTVLGFGLSKIFPDPPAAAVATEAKPPKVDPTPQAVAAHISAGLAPGATAFTWNWAAIVTLILDLLKALGVSLP